MIAGDRLELPNGPYRIVLADPPWAYADARTRASAGMARSAFPVMSAAEIADLPVAAIAADDAVLLLWATGPKMPEALAVMARWGFMYRTVFLTWVKTYGAGRYVDTAPDRGRPRAAGTARPYSGLGHYTKSGSEFLLLGRRGAPLPRLRRDVEQLLFAPVTAHSAKPPEARERVVALFGSLPRVELFARPPVPAGWDAWGLDAPASAMPGHIAATAVQAPASAGPRQQRARGGARRG